MEFLRFGSSIPGSYWGCCAVCIIQNFKVDPDAKASIQLSNGDAGVPITNSEGSVFMGPTYRDIFKERIRVGTFSSTDMPNHGFIAVLTASQVSGGVGHKWLKILKEEGFEFIRTVDNSVYTGQSLEGGHRSAHENYIFGLFRNITGSRAKNPLTPPAAWTSLPSVIPEAWEKISEADRKSVADGQTEVHKKAWKDHGPTKFMTEKQLSASGVPLTLAGERSKYPQQLKEVREAAKKIEQDAKGSKPNAFPQSMPSAVKAVAIGVGIDVVA